jgi:hypothetical protein
MILLLREPPDHDHAGRSDVGASALLERDVRHAVVNYAKLLGATHARADRDPAIVLGHENDQLRERRSATLDPPRPEALKRGNPLGERPAVCREECRNPERARRQAGKDTGLR